MTETSEDETERWWRVTYEIIDPAGEIVETKIDRFPAKSKSDAESIAEKSAVHGRPTETCEVGEVVPDV